MKYAISYFGIMPSGATKEIESAIEKLPISLEEKEKIYCKNLQRLLKRKKENNNE